MYTSSFLAETLQLFPSKNFIYFSYSHYSHQNQNS
jgi:hypothetical protein